MSSRRSSRDAEDEPRGLIFSWVALVKDAILAPIRPFVSRTALRAYLTTLLAIVTALVLLGFAVTAYILFYWQYIPRVGFERTIHLQFDSVYTNRITSHSPHGSASLGSEIMSGQGYDVVIELDMPRTKDNAEAGNFMVELNMYGSSSRSNAGMPQSGIAGTPTSLSDNDALLLATSRRPAILPYRSHWIDLVHKGIELPWYILCLRSESNTLRIPIFEEVNFAQGTKNAPASMRLEIQSTHRLQIYSAKALFRVRFAFPSLKWAMYNHRLISAFVFISTFWMTELCFFGLAWGALALYLQQSDAGKIKAEKIGPGSTAKKIKQEEDDEEEDEEPAKLSDTERTFPTLTGQAPLRYSSPTEREIKREPGLEHETIAVPEAAARAADADVEDEDEDVDFFDSGIGTSLESSGPGRRDSVRRRRGRQGGSGAKVKQEGHDDY